MVQPLGPTKALLHACGFVQSRRNAILMIRQEGSNVIEARLSPSMGYSITGPLETMGALLSPFTLTDPERKAMEWSIHQADVAPASDHWLTLKNLLNRMDALSERS